MQRFSYWNGYWKRMGYVWQCCARIYLWSKSLIFSREMEMWERSFHREVCKSANVSRKHHDQRAVMHQLQRLHNPGPISNVYTIMEEALGMRGRHQPCMQSKWVVTSEGWEWHSHTCRDTVRRYRCCWNCRVVKDREGRSMQRASSEAWNLLPLERLACG